MANSYPLKIGIKLGDAAASDYQPDGRVYPGHLTGRQDRARKSHSERRRLFPSQSKLILHDIRSRLAGVVLQTSGKGRGDGIASRCPEQDRQWRDHVNFRSFLTLLVLIASASTACAQDAKKTADDFAAKWVAAYDAGDAAALAGMFTQDGVFNAPSGAVVKGREAIEKALAGRMKAGWTKETVTTTDAGAAGNAVWAAGDYALVGPGEVAGKQTGGHFGWVMVRDGDVWRVTMLTANVSPPK
jgi:uncharacterized protein (TIGR02246 family)